MPTAEALHRLMEENVKLQVTNLSKSETLTEGKDVVSIHGWVYDIAQGRLIDLNISQTLTKE
jgi:carbonic anhydrase